MGRFKLTTIKEKKTMDNVPLNVVPYRFDLGFLNKLIGYVMRHAPSTVSKRNLVNLREVIHMADKSIYETDDGLLARMLFIENALTMKVENDVNDNVLITEYCKDRGNHLLEETENIILNIKHYKNISIDDMKYINNYIVERLRYGRLVFGYGGKLRELVVDIDSENFLSIDSIVERMVGLARGILGEYTRTSNVESDNSLSLDDEQFWDRVSLIIEELQNPSNIIRTGIQHLNTILGGGYHARRLYVYLGLPAGFKSGILLKTLVDTKMYNKDLVPKREGARKTVLLVTMENELEETIERLFNMNITIENVRNFTTGEAVNMMKENDKSIFALEDENDISFEIMFFPNMSISTDDLYAIIERLEEENKEVVALVLDYIKRIRPALYAEDEKGQLKNVTNELKTLAITHNIPVITAHQINRAGATTVDAAMETGEQDITRFLGRSNVGSAWEVMENSDWSAIINVEFNRETEEYYLTFKRVKLRYRAESDMDYFNQPFAVGNKIHLMDDILLDKPLGVVSLSSDLEGIDTSAGKKGNYNAVEREIIANSSNDIFKFTESLTG